MEIMNKTRRKSATMEGIQGIHHVTAIAGDAQENLDFYAGVLGMRLVKRSVNQDAPRRYHLFYADGEGHPGADLTFFPLPNGTPGRDGTSQATEVVLAVPPDSLAYWNARLNARGVDTQTAGERFGEPTLTFHDPHGLHLALAETPLVVERPFTPWHESTVPAEHQVRGIHAVRLLEQDAEPTIQLARNALGMHLVDRAGGWDRYAGTDLWSGFLEVRSEPAAPRGTPGIGTVHHVAWRVADDAHQAAVRARVMEADLDPTQVIDRFYFRSVYFREPGGVLFELATDGPGFAIDEPADALGETLVLPPWLEPHREAIEASLPDIQLPHLADPRPASRRNAGTVAG